MLGKMYNFNYIDNYDYDENQQKHNNPYVEYFNKLEKNNFVSDLLLNFQKKENNSRLDTLIRALMNFRKECENSKIFFRLTQHTCTFRHIMFHFIEKNLIEISYLVNKKTRISRINKLYLWYIDKLNCHDDLKKIANRTYDEPYEIVDPPLISPKNKETSTTCIKCEKKHRKRDLIPIHKMNEYKIKQVDRNNPILYEQQENENENININMPRTIENRFYNNMIKNEPHHFYTKKFGKSLCTVNRNQNISQTPTVRDIKNNIINNSPKINKEIKASYSVYRPKNEYEYSYLEKEIINNKIKALAEERSQQEIFDMLKNFGMQRAKYKESINNKNEIKNVISMYVNSQQKELISPLFDKYKFKLYKKKDIHLKNQENDKCKIKPIDHQRFTYKLRHNNSTDLYEAKSTKNVSLKHQFSSFMDKNIIENSKIKFNNCDIKEENNKCKNIPHKHPSLKKCYSDTKCLLIDEKKEKIILDNIKNMNKYTKKIIDDNKDSIKQININLKTTTQKKSNLFKQNIFRNKNNEIDNCINDDINNIIHNSTLFKAKIQSRNICNIKNMNTFSEEKERHDFFISAYDMSNIKKINEIFEKRSPQNKLSRNFSNFKNNFLTIRKTMSVWHKKEYDQLVKTLNKNSINDIDKISNNSLEDTLNKESKKSNLYNYRYKLKESSDIYETKNKRENSFSSLRNAIINPNDNLIYSMYYFPRSGSMLLSKEE